MECHGVKSLRLLDNFRSMYHVASYPSNVEFSSLEMRFPY